MWKWIETITPIYYLGMMAMNALSVFLAYKAGIVWAFIVALVLILYYASVLIHCVYKAVTQ